MLKYFKEGQTSTKRQWAADLGEKALKIIGNSASNIKASLKEGEERKRRKRERRKRRGKRKWGEQQKE